MSVRDRIEDSKLLFHAGKLEGALISVLLAVAATSRKRYSGKSDKQAFEQFLLDERERISGGIEVQIEFRGKAYTLENILYKFVRCCLIHDAELDKYISFDYGDFLLDKRGTTEYLTFSSELVLRISYVVVKAPENKKQFPEGLLDCLPEPADLKRTAIVKFQYNNQNFEAFCTACSVQIEEWEDTGDTITWLHLKGLQAFEGQVTGTSGLRLLVPTRYITSIEPGPKFKKTRKRTGGDIGVFPPDKLCPDNLMNLSEIQKSIAELQIPLIETTITIARPQ